MDTTAKNLNKDEKENVLMVLNEFSEEYKIYSKSVNELISSVEKLSEKIILLLDKRENTESENEGANEFKELIGQIEKSSITIQKGISQKIIHHHYISKITWIAAGLFIALALAISGWFITSDKLDGYIANDTKYRYLKLDTANLYLQKLLYRADSLLHKNVSMRQAVINMEEEYHDNFELLQKANHMNAEADNLKEDANKLKAKAGKR